MTSPFETASLQRGRVETWLRIKFAQDNLDTRMYREVLGPDYDRIVLQLRMDALHSDLLYRLFNDQEPRETP